MLTMSDCDYRREVEILNEYGRVERVLYECSIIRGFDLKHCACMKDTELCPSSQVREKNDEC